jgi:mitochondrial fission protein ELM1
MKRVWILDEGSQGHVVQSRGLIRELSKVVSLEVAEVKISKSVSRSLVKRLLRLHGKMWLFHALHPRIQLPHGTPDLIISSGPNSLAALECLSKFHGSPSVFVQGTVFVPVGAVTCILRPAEAETREDIIPIPLLFNEITPEGLQSAKEHYLAQSGREKTKPLKALFIGESSRKIHFERPDWDRLAAFINRAWQTDGVQWLISTSYRTLVETEEQLRAAIAPEAIFDAVWYSRAPRKITQAFLGMADQVFVTMDSLTMMTEAISSGLPIEVLSPARHVLNPSDSHHRYIHGLHQSGLIHLREPGKIAADTFHPASKVEIDYSVAIGKMMERIGWTP